MRPCRIDFRECLKDSPKFRATLEESEYDLELLELKLDKLVKLCNGMVEAGKAFGSANSLFIAGLKDLATHFQDDEMATDDNQMSDALDRFTRMLTELQKYQNVLLDQAHRSIVKSLSNFIKNDIRTVKETRKHFEKISADTDAALVRNAQVLRGKAHEAEEAANTLTAMYSCFCHVSLDYVFQLNVIHSRKKFDVLDTVLGYMHAQNVFFHQGYELFTDAEPYLRQVAAQSEALSVKAAGERRDMEDRHHLVQEQKISSLSIIASPEAPTDSDNGCVRMEGYLFKRTSSTFKTWVRRWFTIVNNQLVYRKRTKDDITVMEEDLRLCTVRPSSDIDRRFCFEVLSPSRTHVLQADSESECLSWVQAIQSAVTNAYHSRHRCSSGEGFVLINKQAEDVTNQDRAAVAGVDVETSGFDLSTTSDGCLTDGTESTCSGSKESVKKPKQGTNLNPVSRSKSILSVSGNRKCCDCGHPDPAWASINLGITLCIECSGIHRSLGVHMSKVRCITLDAWEPDLLRVMAELGNTVVNSIYEANVDETVAHRATSQSTRSEREVWIRAKYVSKSFVRHMMPLSVSADAESEVSGDVESSRPSIVARRWSVCKRKRVRSAKKKKFTSSLLKDSGSGSSLSTTGTGSAAGGAAGSSASEETEAVQQLDVLVFGADVNNTPAEQIIAMVDDSGSEDSVLSEDVDENDDADDDAVSLTSLEDTSVLSPHLLLYKAAKARNLRAMLEALALGANINWINDADSGRTSLIQAVHSGSMTTVEFLLLNGAKVDIRDSHGQSPLHHATVLGHTGQVCQFLKRSANLRAVDDLGQDRVIQPSSTREVSCSKKKDPLSIAMNNANADIVTLLRLAKLNEEMLEGDGCYSSQGDETVNDVFRDFSNMASISPQKLVRNK